MLSIITNFGTELLDLVKHFITFFTSNLLFISTILLIYFTTVIYYYDSIKKYVDTQAAKEAAATEKPKNFKKSLRAVDVSFNLSSDKNSSTLT